LHLPNLFSSFSKIFVILYDGRLGFLSSGWLLFLNWDFGLDQRAGDVARGAKGKVAYSGRAGELLCEH
jgi:hypothetical protein